MPLPYPLEIIIIIINKLQMGWHTVAVIEYTEYT